MRDGAIKGSIQMIEKLRTLNYQMRFMTNTDSRSQESVYQHVKRLRFPVFKEEVCTPSRIVCQNLAERITPAFCLSATDIMDEFKMNGILYWHKYFSISSHKEKSKRLISGSTSNRVGEHYF